MKRIAIAFSALSLALCLYWQHSDWVWLHTGLLSALVTAIIMKPEKVYDVFFCTAEFAYISGISLLMLIPEACLLIEAYLHGNGNNLLVLFLKHNTSCVVFATFTIWFGNQRLTEKIMLR